MDVTDALTAAEGQVLTAFRACVGRPGATQRELDALNTQLEDLRAALKAAPTDARRLEIMESAASVFSEIAKRLNILPEF